jgi:glycosyltransferase involved in cell wall biosynthesis
MSLNNPVVSVIVIVRNDIRIKDCLDSLLAQNYPEEELEIIVVDNASTDNTPEIIRSYPVKFLTESTIGMGWARNKGLSQAKGKYIAFIDADCIATPDWLAELLKGFTNESIGAVGGKILKQEGHNLIEIASRDLVIGKQTEPQYLPIYPAPYVVTANVGYRGDVLNEIGGFDPIFFSGADVDVSWRLSIAGCRIVCQSNAIVYHANRSSISKYFRQFYRYGLGHALLFKKYKKLTKKVFLFNIYPFQGLGNLLFIRTPVTLFGLITKKCDLIDVVKMFLDLVEYIALIFGDVHGAIKFGVFYL